MTHYRMQDNDPSAIILAKNPRTSSLDELRTYQGNTIYLNNGDEFQIRLFNPLREKIGVQIGINGDLSHGLLVLNPGEDVVIDRFIDDQSKMLFETYSYDANNQAASNAVAENGLVDVKFFKEKKIYRTPKSGRKLTKSSPKYGGTTTRGITGQSLDGDFDTFSTTNANSRLYGTLSNTAGMGSVTMDDANNVFFSASLDFDTTEISSSLTSSLDFVSDPLPEQKKETGRVEKGNESEQNFTQVQVEFESLPFYTIAYNLKPVSERSLTDSKTYTETKVREYCPSCGYRIRNSRWNFCPKCGDEV